MTPTTSPVATDPALPPVTIVVPVYRGADDVRRCLAALRRHAAPSAVAARLVLVDDASPEDEVRRLLDEAVTDAGPLPTTVVRHSRNRGFVASANEGLAHGEGDVVLLNADTAVTRGWLDRMTAAARHSRDVATVTPLTNSGSICTLPQAVIDRFDLQGPEPRIDDCAEYVAQRSLQLLPEVIAGVGFCMLVTRQAIDLCGLLDEAAFGLGYGEEVDFSLRCTRLGLRHLVEDSTFVYHRGGGSFGGSRDDAMSQASAILRARYPYFAPTNARERRVDPLAVPFRALELGLGDRRPAHGFILHVLHEPSPRGGTEKHVVALMEALGPEFGGALLYPTDAGFVLQEWAGPGEPDGTSYLLPGPARPGQLVDEMARDALVMALDLLPVSAVHLHNLIGHSLAPLEVLADFDGPVLCSIHDYYLMCPNHSLLYRDGPACGIPEDLDVCGRCLPVTRGLSQSDLVAFRTMVAAHLDTVDCWVTPSQAAADHLLRVYDVAPDRLVIIPHGSVIDPTRWPRQVDEDSVLEGPIRLGFVGRGWAKKGLDVVNAAAPSLRAHGIEIHHFGDAKEPVHDTVVQHGAYDNERLPGLLHRDGISVVVLPGPYEETYGLVMDEALLAGLPVIVGRYGALGERTRRLGVGWTIDPEDPETLVELVRNLDACRLELLRATRQAVNSPVRTMASTVDQYAALYRGDRVPRGDGR